MTTTKGCIGEYQKNDTLGKSQLDLIIKVYDGAINSFKEARGFYEKKDFFKGHEQLDRVRKFLTHLYTTLDFEKGGKISVNLGQLYVFVLTQLDVIRATKDLKKIDDNIKILNNLRSGWAGLKEQGLDRPKGVPSPKPSPVGAGGQFSISG
ncbi:MAG: flagellar export chaperone FliS [Candidatus Zixiibacteriota bacterium]